MNLNDCRAKHILLVDDEKNLTQMLSMLLETRGYEVEVAHSGKEALEKIVGRVDLVLLDLILPDCHGFDICRRFKEDQQTRHIPIIMISAHSLYEDKVEGLYLGADDFLSKPCEQEELFARIEVAMRKHGRGYDGAGDEDREKTICELRRVLDHDSLGTYYQPIYSLDPFELLGVEVLTRPEAGGVLARPDIFFQAALEYGMYTDLEIMAWGNALRALNDQIDSEKIFLNCNPYFIESSPFLRIRALFDRYHIPSRQIVIELTERSAISNFEFFRSQLRHYREYGFHFAVDDVGGGYASLESIVETHPEVVKIDQHIVRELDTNTYKRTIVEFIVSLCKENHILSIAEGIEKEAELRLVQSMGVDAVQGYYFFKPSKIFDLASFRQVAGRGSGGACHFSDYSI